MNPLDLKYLFEDLDTFDDEDLFGINYAYEEYLESHIANVKKGFEWFRSNLPALLQEDNSVGELAYYGTIEEVFNRHDRSKYTRIPDRDNYYELRVEYDPYANYFYGEKTPEVSKLFDLAWLSHIHQNPHHWQHWLLQNDEDGQVALDMPYVFILEMIFDWWSFSWKSGNLMEIFTWYDNHKDKLILSKNTQTTVENILNQLRTKLEENNAEH